MDAMIDGINDCQVCQLFFCKKAGIYADLKTGVPKEQKR
jgi:hypothetical protein